MYLCVVTPGDKENLKEYLKGLQSVQVSGLNRDEQEAYWINLYNPLFLLDSYQGKLGGHDPTCLERIKASSRRMEVLVCDLLTLSIIGILRPLILFLNPQLYLFFLFLPWICQPWVQ
jgi:hypothetical protein